MFAIKTRSGRYIAGEAYKLKHYQCRFCWKVIDAFIFSAENHANDYIVLFNLTGATIERVENHA